MPNAPFMYTCEEGQSFYFLGTLMTLNAGSAETGSHFSLIEQVSPPGFASALHMHHAKDEAFYILEGRFTFFCGDQTMNATAGSFVYLPKDVPHAFGVEGNTPACLLQLTAPGGLEQGFIEMGEPATALTLLPPYVPTPDDMQRMAEISARVSRRNTGTTTEQQWK